MKKIKSLIICMAILVNNISLSQRISSGVSVGVPSLFGMIHYKQNYYSPENMFRVYFVNPPNAEKEKFNRLSIFGLSKMYKSIGISAGYNIKVDYKRFILRFGYQFAFINYSVKLNQFSGNEIDEYPADFKLQSYHHRFPVLFTIDLNKKNNSPFIYGGIEYGYIFARSEKLENDYNVFSDRFRIPFMYNHLYNNKGYLNVMLGYGFKYKKFEWLFGIKSRIDNARKLLTMDTYSIDFNMNFYFNYKSFKRKNYIFIDE